MNWLLLSFLTAVSVASQDTWIKYYFSRLNSFEMASIPLVFSFPLFLFAIVFIPVPQLDKIFWVCFLVSLPLNGMAMVLYMRAIRISPLSLTLPYLAFTPAFMIVTGYLFLGELPGVLGVAGIVVTCIGAYILNLTKGCRPVDPLKSVFSEQGSLIMLGVAILFSIAAVIGKKAILHSSPLFFTVSFFLVFDITMILFSMAWGKVSLKTLSEEPVRGFGAGLLFFSHVLCHGFAISLTKAAYMISVKRFSILIGILYGRVIFGEKNSAIRFAGALLMIAGASLITLSGDV